MKKALIVLLILAVAGGLFAQTVSGKVSTGINFALGEDDIPTSATEPVKAEVNFAGGADDWGVKIGTSATRLDGATLTVGDAYGWVKFGGMFELSAGTGRGGWGTWGPWDKKVTEVLGVKLAIAPIDGLSFGFRLGYPNDGVKANKIGNFFQETGIGATFDAGIWSAATGLNMDSEETNGSGFDASWYFGFKFTGLSIFDIMVDGGYDNLTEKSGASLFFLGEKLAGSVAGIGWEVWAKEEFVSPLHVWAGAKASYSMALTDQAKLGFEVGAGLTILDKFSFDTWYAKVTLDYSFNDNVSTGVEFKLDGVVDPSKITPNLKWTIGYSF